MKNSTSKVTPSANMAVQLRPGNAEDATAFTKIAVDPQVDRELLDRFHAEAKKTFSKPKN